MLTRMAASLAVRLAATLAGLVLVAMPGAAQSVSVFGRWRTADGKAIVNIERCGADLCGRIDAILDPAAPRTDIHNPGPALRSRSLGTVLVLSAFERSGWGWRNGKAYDPSSGRSYDARLSLADDGRLAVTGCVVFFCRTQYWKR